MQDLWDSVVKFLTTASADMALKLLGAAVMLVVGFKLIKLVLKLLEKSLSKSKLDQGILGFVDNAASFVLRFTLIISVLMYLGVPAASFIAILSSAGLAIGLALQGSLSNFAGGLMLLFFHPFRVGDNIKTDNAEGVVQQISIMYTTLRTLDGRKVVIPNANLSNTVITDSTWYDTRRAEVSIMVGFLEDIDVVRGLMLQAASQSKLVLNSPAPTATLEKLQDGAMVFTLRCWAKTSDWWQTTLEVTEGIKRLLDEKNIVITAPLRDVRQLPKA